MQERSEFVENMGAKRRRKMKGGRAAANPAAAALEGGQRILTQYEGAAEANPLNYVLISVRGEIERIIMEGTGGASEVVES